MNQTVPQQPDKKDCTKAGFAIVDELLKAYNGGETYVKRFLTFVGIGGVITGTALGYRPMVNPGSPAPQTQPQPIIIHTAPPESLPASSPTPQAKPASPPAKPELQPKAQPATESQPQPLQTRPAPPPTAQPKGQPTQPARPRGPVIAVQSAPSAAPVQKSQKPSIEISPPTLKREIPTLPFEIDESDEDD